MLGSMVAAAPGLAAEVAAAGHEIAVHGWDHRYLTLRGPQETFRDMARAREVIAETTGQVPEWALRRLCLGLSLAGSGHCAPASLRPAALQQVGEPCDRN